MNTLVTIKISTIPGEMAVVQTYLDDHGIFNCLQDEFISQVHPAVGGSRLQVKQTDAADAIELLIQGGFAKREDYEENSYPNWVIKISNKISSWFK